MRGKVSKRDEETQAARNAGPDKESSSEHGNETQLVVINMNIGQQKQHHEQQ
jgi:hypothetical protein